MCAAVPHDIWTYAQYRDTPPLAVHAGYDIDKTILYVGRVFHNGEYIPAKVFPKLKKASIPYQGQEIGVYNFEYLVGDKYFWVPGQPFPSGAVFVNPLSLNEHLYVGRAKHCGGLLCGKFLRSNNRLYIPFGGREIILTDNYEILVHRDRIRNNF